jgi:hypothetical protein
MFAAQNFIPFAIGDTASPNSWAQRYCTLQGTDAWGGMHYESTGLSIMSARSVAFTESGRMVMGCMDLLGFIAENGKANASKYMDPYFVSQKTGANRIATIGDSVYMLRGGPFLETEIDFGYEENGDFAFQRIVIAQYTP